jgi:hypothetical protein
VAGGALSNNRLELTIALAPAPRVNAKEGHYACPLSSGHRALAAQARCWADAASARRGGAGGPCD